MENRLEHVWSNILKKHPEILNYNIFEVSELYAFVRSLVDGFPIFPPQNFLDFFNTWKAKK